MFPDAAIPVFIFTGTRRDCVKESVAHLFNQNPWRDISLDLWAKNTSPSRCVGPLYFRDRVRYARFGSRIYRGNAEMTVIVMMVKND